MKYNSIYPQLDKKEKEWVDLTFENLSVRQKIGQMLAPMVIHWDPDKDPQQLCDEAIAAGVGTVHMCGSSYKTIRGYVKQLFEKLPVPPLVSADFEFGSGGIREGFKPGCPMMAGAIDDIELAKKIARSTGELTAKHGRAAGINWTFGPVVDVPINFDAAHPNTRTYARDTERISILSGEYIKGLQSQGFAATMKHFPGAGVDFRDSHVATEINDLPFDEWMNEHGKTFGAAIDNGVYGAMIGHIALPCKGGFNKKNGMPLPATLDSKIQFDLLRKEMGFGGVIVSDAIEMGGALAHTDGHFDATVQNIATGSDVVLFVADLPKQIEAVEQALADGRVTMKMINGSVLRILSLKAKLGLFRKDALPSDEEAAKVFDNEQMIVSGFDSIEALGKATVENAITLQRDWNNELPLKLKKGDKITICVFPKEETNLAGIVLPDENLEGAYPELAKEFQRRGFEIVCVNNRYALQNEAKDSQAVFYLATTNPVAGRGHNRLTKAALRAIDWDIIQSEIPTILVNLGNPYLLWELSMFPNCICGYRPSDEMQRAVVAAVLGEIEFKGKLPVEVPGLSWEASRGEACLARTLIGRE